jgi:hypothetical protein
VLPDTIARLRKSSELVLGYHRPKQLEICNVCHNEKKRNVYQQPHTHSDSNSGFWQRRKGKTALRLKADDKKAFLLLCVLIFMLYPFSDKNLRKWNSEIKNFRECLNGR